MTRTEIIEVLCERLRVNRQHLEEAKNAGLAVAQHADWPWYGVVVSMSTLGGADRWKDTVQPIYDSTLSWSTLQRVKHDEEILLSRFRKVGRYKNKTALYLLAIFRHFDNMGGPHQVQAHLSGMSVGKVLKFWCQFKGFGKKYSRNIMMDIYDPRFRNGYFAIDSRIQALLPLLGYQGRRNYEHQEAYLNEFLPDLAVESWELDRLLFKDYEYLKQRLS